MQKKKRTAEAAPHRKGISVALAKQKGGESATEGDRRRERKKVF